MLPDASATLSLFHHRRHSFHQTPHGLCLHNGYGVSGKNGIQGIAEVVQPGFGPAFAERHVPVVDSSLIRCLTIGLHQDHLGRNAHPQLTRQPRIRIKFSGKRKTVLFLKLTNSAGRIGMEGEPRHKANAQWLVAPVQIG